jgi:hypothetical protein
MLFKFADAGRSSIIALHEEEYQQNHVLRTQKRKALLEAFVEESGDLGPIAFGQ